MKTFMKTLPLSYVLLLFLTVSALCQQPENSFTTAFYASRCGVVLDSDVYKGGGTDVTEPLQAVLDRAPKLGRLHLILDGAARISKCLKVYSNTTIECPDKSCGLFLSDNSNCSLLCNVTGDMEHIRDRNITLIGGTYNNNSPGQVHHLPNKKGENGVFSKDDKWVFALEFYGIEQLLLRDVTIANQRTFALTMANWKYVKMENIHIDRRVRKDKENQDGLHFFGPGRFLTLRDIHGNSGDDFIALTPDEHDSKSAIEDVLIDGVQLDDADQGIRMLVRGKGKLDRVIVRNVTGTYRSYGFIINPWYAGNGGHYGNIMFDMIDLRPMKNNYTYSPPFLFKLGGNIESLTLKNIYHHTPDYDHCLFIVGGEYYLNRPERPNYPTKIDRLIIDGLYIDERNVQSVPETYIRVKSQVGVLSVNNVILRRAEELPKSGSLINVDGGAIQELILNNISAPELKLRGLTSLGVRYLL
ncbi:MAG: hypothetical protein LBT46_15345 [Planctomycetaceae bacterium]|jgi:hypothetical protein|nr:hypothetical protein [Planctomycetaceae bacterium]